MKCKLNSVSCGGESSTEDFNERKKGSFYTACCNANKASYILYTVFPRKIYGLKESIQGVGRRTKLIQLQESIILLF
jgi:hypothetical protein